MKFKSARKLSFVVLAATLSLLWIGGQSLAAQKPVKLKLAGVFPPPSVSMMSETVKAWADLVTKKTNGAITFEFLWGCSLGAPAEYIELCKNGVVDVINIHQWYTPTKMPLGNFEYVFPFGPTDYELVVKAKTKIRAEFPEFAKELDNQNSVMIADLVFGVYNFMSKKPMNTVKDFDGTKISLIGRYFGRWLPPGSNAVVRPGHERYDMLRAGVVDIDLLPFDLLYSFKINEVTNYYVQVDLISCCGGCIIMNKDRLNSLTPETQKIIMEAGTEAQLIGANEILPKWHKRCETEWKAAGLKFIKFPKDEKKKWAGTVEDTAAEWAKEMDAKGLPGTKIVKRWQEITEEMGYEWPRKWGGQ